MPRLVLINPNPASYRLSRGGFRVQPLSLAYLAGCTPARWDVVIDDENIDTIEVRDDADLVGITTLTSNVNRAYELAGTYRGKGVPVVLGGIHVSMVPDEAERYADAVVVGEAESVWETVIEDFERGELKSRYEGERTEFRRPVRPRRDLVSPAYTIGSIQTSRGCPFDCEFCSVRAFNGPKFRQRDPDDVLEELAGVPQRTIFFTDDNLVGYSAASRERAKAIFRGMIDRGMDKKWICQTSINFADDEETLELAHASGCVLALVGIESVNDNVLKGAMNKTSNSRRGSAYYEEFLETVHRHGIAIIGNMVFGNDEEDADTFEQTAAFFDRGGLDIPWPGLLTPYPGTRLAERMRKEGRLVYTDYPADYRHYNRTLITTLANCSRREFFDAFQRFAVRTYSLPKSLKRAWRTFRHSRDVRTALLVYGMNRSLCHRFSKGLEAPDE